MKRETKLNPFVYIRGIEERGKEVIAELERRGGVNGYKNIGTDKELLYFIDIKGYINWQPSRNAKWIKEHYEEIKLLPYKPKHKELVWTWDDNFLTARLLCFYNAKKDMTFPIDGVKYDCKYEHYAPYEGEWPDWAKKAYKMLED